MPTLPKPIKVRIIYDKTLSKITGVNEEETIVSEGLIFILFLKFIFDSYPEITRKYPPGSLGLLLNGHAPTDYDVLKDKDEVSLMVGGSSQLIN